MSEFCSQGNPSTGQGGKDDQPAVDTQQQEKRKGALLNHAGGKLGDAVGLSASISFALRQQKKSRNRPGCGTRKLQPPYFINSICRARLIERFS